MPISKTSNFIENGDPLTESLRLQLDRCVNILEYPWSEFNGRYVLTKRSQAALV